jgi:glycosyltransferase involved in cell wall biosynthesis
VVATDVGGIAGVLKDGETGYLVAPADPQALAAGCLKLIGNSVVRKKMGVAANHHIQAHYSMDAMVDSISELYQTLLKERSA